MSFIYRKEIDGLRALAIIPVVLYHANILGFSGGYIGVDIFFAISGFLITSIILRDLRKGTFSFSNFFQRRIRRIFPALFVVISMTSIFGYFYFLYPDDLEGLGKSIFSQSIFLSNIFFMRKTGYFDQLAETQPLLHLWTLSVEEQFYLLFPVILFTVFAFFKKKLLPIVSTLLILSFALSIYLVNFNPGNTFTIPLIPDLWGRSLNLTAGFYILPSRAWELLVGSVIAITALSIKSKSYAEIVSAIGIGAIIYSITQFDANTRFPGFAAMLPVLGSAAIIISNVNTKTYVGKFLSSSLLVWVGLISYSLYLWHWPVLVFGKIILSQPDTIDYLAMILLSASLAWITYILIETPFIKRRFLYNKNTMMFVGILSFIVLGTFGYCMKYINTNVHLPQYTQNLFAARDDRGPRYAECILNKNLETLENDGPCLLGQPLVETRDDFIILGDSHSGEIFHVIDNLAKQNEVTGSLFYSSECVPIPNVSRKIPGNECYQTKNIAINYLTNNNIKNILLVARWNYYTGSNDAGFIGDADTRIFSKEESRVVFEQNLIEMVEMLNKQGVHITIMSQVPEHTNFNPRDVFYKAIRERTPPKFDRVSMSDHRNYNDFTDKIFKKLERDYGVEIINPEQFFCSDKEGCLFELNNKILYRDADHLNYTGAKELEPLFEDYIDSLK